MPGDQNIYIFVMHLPKAINHDFELFLVGVINDNKIYDET